jgi:hypothetical protein
MEVSIFISRWLYLFLYWIDLQVTFEYNASEGVWSQSIVNLDIKDRMISFKIPNFPYSVTNSATVDIILRQDNRILSVLKYSYLAAHQWK